MAQRIRNSNSRSKATYQILSLTLVNCSLFLVLLTVRIRLPVFGRLEWRRFDEFWPGLIFALAGAYFIQFLLSRFEDYRICIAGVGVSLIGVAVAAFTLGFAALILIGDWRHSWPLLLAVIGTVLWGQLAVRHL